MSDDREAILSKDYSTGSNHHYSFKIDVEKLNDNPQMSNLQKSESIKSSQVDSEDQKIKHMVQPELINRSKNNDSKHDNLNSKLDYTNKTEVLMTVNEGESSDRHSNISSKGSFIDRDYKIKMNNDKGKSIKLIDMVSPKKNDPITKSNIYIIIGLGNFGKNANKKQKKGEKGDPIFKLTGNRGERYHPAEQK
jgi:hypothetical protein